MYSITQNKGIRVQPLYNLDSSLTKKKGDSFQVLGDLPNSKILLTRYILNSKAQILRTALFPSGNSNSFINPS